MVCPLLSPLLSQSPIILSDGNLLSTLSFSPLYAVPLFAEVRRSQDEYPTNPNTIAAKNALRDASIAPKPKSA